MAAAAKGGRKAEAAAAAAERRQWAVTAAEQRQRVAAATKRQQEQVVAARAASGGSGSSAPRWLRRGLPARRRPTAPPSNRQSPPQRWIVCCQRCRWLRSTAACRGRPRAAGEAGGGQADQPRAWLGKSRVEEKPPTRAPERYEVTGWMRSSGTSKPHSSRICRRVQWQRRRDWRTKASGGACKSCGLPTLGRPTHRCHAKAAAPQPGRGKPKQPGRVTARHSQACHGSRCMAAFLGAPPAAHLLSRDLL